MREAHSLAWWREEARIAREFAAEVKAEGFPGAARPAQQRGQVARRRAAAITRRRPYRAR